MSNKLPTQEELDAFEAGLSDADKVELKRQQMVHALVTREDPKPVDWSNLGSGDFDRESTRLFAEYERKKAKGE